MLSSKRLISYSIAQTHKHTLFWCVLQTCIFLTRPVHPHLDKVFCSFMLLIRDLTSNSHSSRCSHKQTWNTAPPAFTVACSHWTRSLTFTHLTAAAAMTTLSNTHSRLKGSLRSFRPVAVLSSWFPVSGSPFYSTHACVWRNTQPCRWSHMIPLVCSNTQAKARKLQASKHGWKQHWIKNA